MLICVYVLNELHVNADIKNINHQYIITSKWKVNNMGLDITTLAPLPKTLKDEYPNLVANYYRFSPVTNVVSAGDNHFKENISICDTNLVSLYGFKLLYGNEKSAFKNNSSAIITEALSLKLFGNKSALNKTITITNTTASKQDYTVSAVLKTMLYNSVNNFLGPDGYSVFLPFEGNKFFAGGSQVESWDNGNVVGMIELKPGVLPKDMVRPIAQTLALHESNYIKGNLQASLAPMKDYYLKDNNNAVQKMINILCFAGAFILLMAVINFINISIGTSSYRLKEIGLRKVFGSIKMQIIIQYIIESLMLAFIAGLISIASYELLRPLFIGLLNTNFDHIWQFGFKEICLLFLIVIGIGIISGVYPAFVLSSSNVINAVKGKLDTVKGGLMLRKILLIIQFSIAIIIFISALNVSKQVSYFFTRDLGYNKEQVVVLTAFPKQWDSAGVLKMETVRDELMQIPAVSSASLSFEIPERVPPNTLNLIPEGSTTNQPIIIPTIVADENYATTFGLKMKEGTFFHNYKGNSVPSQVVLNEAAAKALGWGSAIGKKVRMQMAGFTLTVTGVVKDFNYSSMSTAVGPLAFMHVKDDNTYRYLTLKLNTSNISKAITDLKTKWKSISPDSPFEYFFMEDNFKSQYQSELDLKKASNVATVLNIIIVLLGVFGIVAFTLTKRRKEIAVRKVLGADIKNIILLFIKDYAILILIANIIAWPLAYIISNQWLQNYAYRIQQNIIPFLFVTVFIFLTVFILITLQCFKVASAKPIESLKYE